MEVIGSLGDPLDPEVLLHEGLELPIKAFVRVPPLTLVRIPEGVGDPDVRSKLLRDYELEIGGGLGDFKGKAWRIGFMGGSATPRHVARCVEALGVAIGRRRG